MKNIIWKLVEILLKIMLVPVITSLIKWLKHKLEILLGAKK